MSDIEQQRSALMALVSIESIWFHLSALAIVVLLYLIEKKS